MTDDNDVCQFCQIYADQLAQWKEIATQLAIAIMVGNNHGYGLRIGDDALAEYEKLKEKDRVFP